MAALTDDELIEAKRRIRLQRKRSVSQRLTIFNLIANAALALGKGAVGVITGSLSVEADALNSLADTVYSLVLLVGMHLSLRPADRSHPQGHRAYEPLISLVIGVSIALVAVELVVRGVSGLADPPELVRSPWTVVILLAAMLVKATISVWARRSAIRIHSPALRAVANDAAADILASAAAMVGYLGAVAGYPRADPVCSLIVAAFVARTALQVLWENVGYIVGRSAPSDIEAAILRVACEPDMVCAVHDLKAYFRGPELHVSFHLEVDQQVTLEQAHELEQRIRLALLDIPEVDDVSIHLDPVGEPPSAPVV